MSATNFTKYPINFTYDADTITYLDAMYCITTSITLPENKQYSQLLIANIRML